MFHINCHLPGISSSIVMAGALLVAPEAAHSESPTPMTPPFATCAIHHSASYYSRLNKMPAVIRGDLVKRAGKVAEPNEPFNEEDVVEEPWPSRRFIGGLVSHGRYIIWYYHGGRGPHIHIVEYVIGVSGMGPSPAPILMGNLAGDPCIATDALLDGVFPSGDW